MAKFTLPHFGQIATDNLEEFYDVDINFNGNKLQIDLNFENKNIEFSQLEKVKLFIENLEKFNKQNKSYILDDYNDEDGDTVKFYLEHHLEELEKEELSKIINVEDDTTEQEKQLLAKLNIVRVGLYPDSEDTFAIFDYSIGEEITNYLVVINTNETGELDYMSMES